MTIIGNTHLDRVSRREQPGLKNYKKIYLSHLQITIVIGDWLVIQPIICYLVTREYENLFASIVEECYSLLVLSRYNKIYKLPGLDDKFLNSVSV